MAKRDSQSTIGRNTVSGRQLLNFVERIEAIREQKKQLGEDEKLVFAELKATGFSPVRVRDVLKRRAAKPQDLAEDQAMLDLYLHAAGLANEPPLFAYVSAMGVDVAVRDQVVEACKALAPAGGDIVVTMGGRAVRIWRDEAGEPHAEEVVERPAAAAEPLPPARREKPPPPDVDEAEAAGLGREAARGNRPVIANPFPWNDRRRQRWDEGWREAAGSDGMGPKTADPPDPPDAPGGRPAGDLPDAPPAEPPGPSVGAGKRPGGKR